MTLEPYLEKHRPENQRPEKGVTIDPCLRKGFDSTDNNDRDPLEWEDWFGVPYILTSNWDEQETHQRRHRRDLEQGKCPEVEISSKEKFENGIGVMKENWFSRFPSGTSYEVRCLDGGAWDRSTYWGEASSLEEAVELAENGPERRNRG